ncbi:hypothetical protein GW17_00035598 [Ensete ventricosum]|nr:hypothetical protein GW17_00035598 [Ensete ventricosum]RZS07394.1 hypothetical protein BHM03_00038225 [Ensete ventricosum]
MVLDLSSSPLVYGRVVVPRGEIKSPVNRVRVETIGVRSFSTRSSFWKALKYKMLVELLVSTIILFTQALVILAEIPKALSWSGTVEGHLGLDYCDVLHWICAAVIGLQRREIGRVSLQRSIVWIPLERRTLDLLHILYPDMEYRDI